MAALGPRAILLALICTFVNGFAGRQFRLVNTFSRRGVYNWSDKYGCRPHPIFRCADKEGNMTKRSIPALGLLMLLITPAVFGKGHTVKVTFRGGTYTTPLEITNQNVGAFDVWAGPGVRVDGVEQTEGFIINWAKGPVAEPAATVDRFDVAFYSTERDGGAARRVYAVSYAFDDATGQGYVYLPGKGDTSYLLNAATMHHGHGLEGHWFYATQEWDAFAKAVVLAAEPHR
jgi:hypothetical protein